jgi:di/tricarboxylate transporter
MENYLGLISLVFLIAVVGLGFWRKANIGILALGFAIILGRMGGISDKEILAGFDASLFVTLVGVTFLFGMAQVNGTLELLAKKAVSLVGKKTYLVPFIIFLVAGTLTALGPGHIPIGALMTVVAVTIAVHMDQNPILFALVAKLAANAFAMSPIAPAGIIGTSLGEKVGQFGFEKAVMINCILWGVVFFIIFCVIFRADKIRTSKPLRREDLDKFNKEQITTILGMTAMVGMVLFLEINVGLASFFVATILVLTGVCNEKKALEIVPWGTLILICGVGVLMNIVTELGGIDVISKALLAIMGPKTANPIIAGTSSILSLFSSTTGVVMPTMIPTLPNIAEKFAGNTSFVQLLSCVMTGSLAAAFSPASTGGGLILAAYASAKNASSEEQNKLFGELFAIAIGTVLLNVVFAWLGLYSFVK